jgi:hypothetical protein
MTTYVADRQTLADVAIEVYGSIEGIFALADRNGIDNLTEELTVGRALSYVPEEVVRPDIARRYALLGIKPATRYLGGAAEGAFDETFDETFD